MQERSVSHLDSLVIGFDEADPLRGRLLEVLHQLPGPVIEDFASDTRFSIAKMNHSRGEELKLLMALPSPDGIGSRCVVLKERLATCEHRFGLYVIAHELAHAYLRNGPWEDITDIEEAADALAAHWGFTRL